MAARIRRHFAHGRARVLALAMAGMVAVPQFASAQPVVQPLPAPAAAELREALQRLSRNPDSLSALVTAGRASLELDDSDAAHGFFTRAEAVAPNDGRVLAGLALVELARENPVAALRLFDRAEAAGESMEPHAAQRGLAYDLVGMNDSAQSMYRQALARGEDPVVVRRLALSQAIAGNAEASEATLLPLLQAQDLSAYRTRAFALAIAGRPDEAVSIAETMLPARLSRRLAPYLRYMPRLTRAQQAAAANFGTFPDASEIGRDDPEIAAFTAAEPQMPVAGGADSRLIPGGEPLGPATAQAQAGAQPPTLPAGPAQQPAGSEVPVAASISAAQPAVPREERRIDLSEVFADFELPSGSPPPPSREAVDLTRITPAREAPPAPPPPAHPSRHWVQLATGQDTAAFRWDWRRIVRNSGGLLERREPYTAPWGASHRLVTGPFASESEAQDFVTRLKEQGIDSFRFTSAAGEELTPVR